MFSRRDLLSVSFGAFASARAEKIPSNVGDAELGTLIRDPLLDVFFRRQPTGIDPSGCAGLNRGGFRTIEEQRNGAGWITHGIINNVSAWKELGWKAIDLGLSYQEADGGFGRFGYYHSNNLFLEALARALLLDPLGQNSRRISGLARGVDWLMRPQARGSSWDDPYTHRFYIRAATFALSATLLNKNELFSEAKRWADEGLNRQRSNGTNPELGGFDVSYQMVGPLYAARYATVVGIDDRSNIAKMMYKACMLEGSKLLKNGDFDSRGSTRVGTEIFGGTVKVVNYPEIFESLAYCFRATGSADLYRMFLAVGRPRGWLTDLT